MAFIQYLTFDGTALPLPDFYEIQMDDVEADSGGETEAGTQQRDFKRRSVPEISMTFMVTKKWLLKFRRYRSQDKITVRYNHGSEENAKMYMDGYKEKLEHETSTGGIWKVSFSLKSY